MLLHRQQAVSFRGGEQASETAPLASSRGHAQDRQMFEKMATGPLLPRRTGGEKATQALWTWSWLTVPQLPGPW